MSSPGLTIPESLILNNEIALVTMRIASMEKFPYPKLQEDANEWYYIDSSPTFILYIKVLQTDSPKSKSRLFR